MSDGGDETASLEHDPFAPHEAFVASVAGQRQMAVTRPDVIEPLEPLDVTIDKLVDLDALEARAGFEGMVRSTRTLEEEELDGGITDALMECKAQFHLRNLGRAERFADPDEPLEFDVVVSEAGLPEPNPEDENPMDPLPDLLLQESSMKAVEGFQADRRRVLDEMAWNEHFSRELKEDATGPLWKPTTPTGDEDARE